MEVVKERLEKELKPFMKYLVQAKDIWLVGGAIRDAIINLPLVDFDFVIKGDAISFARWFAKKIFGSFVLLDKENNEARVVLNNKINFDFTSATSIEEDAKRRDFTINSIYIKLPKMEILDPFYGIKDIDKKIIKMIDEKNFISDPLRILRAFRFAATLGFNIEKRTREAIKKYKSLLDRVAKERIRLEFFKLLSANNSYRTIKKLANLHILDIIIKEITPMRKTPQYKPFGNLLDHSILTLKKIEELSIFNNKYLQNIVILKLAALLHDIGKPYCYVEDGDKIHFYGHEKVGANLIKNIKEEIRLSNWEARTLYTIILYHMRPHLLAREKNPTDKAILRIVRDGGDCSPQIFIIAYADALASGGLRIKSLLNVCKRGIKLYEDTTKSKFERLITGYDLINLGFKPGPIFKDILQKVEELQIAGELKTKADAINFIKEKWLKNI